MGLSYSQSQQLVTVKAAGDFDLEDIRQVFSEIRARHQLGAPLRILILDAGSNFDPPAAMVKELVGVWVGLFAGIPTKIACVVQRDVHFGIARMAELLADGRLPIAAFRHKTKALKWLNESFTATEAADSR